MSAFLGPIHYWLDNKIRLQQSLIEDLYQLGNTLGLSLEVECKRLFGTFDTRPLEEIIDESNIHGWLQERVSYVEYAYAYCVTKIIEKDPSMIDTLGSFMEKEGESKGQAYKDVQPSGEEVYKIITDSLLDGMPCDHANRLLSQSNDTLIYTRELCVHQAYWEEVKGDISLYYKLREAWLKGFLKVLGYTLEMPDEKTYEIKKKAS